MQSDWGSSPDWGWGPLFTPEVANSWWIPRTLRSVFTGTAHTLLTNLVADECAARLQAAMEQSASKVREDKLLGEATRSWFALRLNDFSLTAVGRMREVEHGTLIHIRLALAPSQLLGHIVFAIAGLIGWLVVAKMHFLDHEPFHKNVAMYLVFSAAFPFSLAISSLPFIAASRGQVRSPIPVIQDALEAHVLGEKLSYEK